MVTASNHNAGINGGIANGMPVVFRTVVKPTPSIYKQQDTVDYLAKKNAELSIQGRHDPCIVPRAAIVQTCSAALAVADLLTARYGEAWMTHPTGEAVITPGFNLPSRYVIHTAGPIWRDGKHDEERLLRSCYRNSMELAARQGCASIAFPLISSGIYGYPKAEALHVTLDEIRRFLGDAADSGHDLDVYLCVFDKTAFEISSSIDKRLRAYIDDYYVAEHEDTLGSRTYELLALQRFSDNKPKADRAVPSGVLDMPDFLGDMGETPVYSAPSAAPSPKSAGHVDDAVLSNLDEPFNIILLRLIDAKGYSDVEVYKRANINRKLFSKIRCGDGYMPSKKTVLALAIALRLNIDETQDILACAGYALSHSVKFDVIVEFFIVHEMFDVFTINEMLFRYDQPLLGQ